MIDNWSEDRVNRLTKLWADGLSAAEIAAELGHVSRNAVLGKIHRLKLPPKFDAAELLQRRINGEARRARKLAQDPSSPAAISCPPRRARPGKIAGSLFQPTFARAALESQVRKPVDTDTPMSEPEVFGVTLIDLTNLTCRWPKGDPLADDFMFCGETSANFKEGRPYCPFHTVLSIDRTRTANSARRSKQAAD